MFYINTAMRNLLRHKSKNILNFCICLIVILLLNLYLGNIESSKAQLHSLPDAIPIYCRITNLDSSQEAGLEISEELIKDLKVSPYVKDAIFTVRLMAGEGDFTPEEWKGNLNIPIMGINTIDAVEGIECEQIQLKSGTSLDFYSFDKAVCMVSCELMRDRQWEMGDVIPLNIFYYYHESPYNPYNLMLDRLGVTEFEIVGTMEEIYSSADVAPPRILIPFDTIRERYHEADIPFMADSASFYVADALRLNEFKEEMHSFGLMSVVPAANYSYVGNALSARDATFISAASRLRQGIDILQGFFPIVFITVVFVGYITSYLLIYSRQKEFALMRSLGVSNNGCFATLLTEQSVIVIAGIVAGSLLSVCFGYYEGKSIALVGMIFIMSFMVGNMAALWRFARNSVMEVLFQVE